MAKTDLATQLVTFSVGEEEFGVDILKVQEIIKHVAVTRVPSAPPGVEGVINLRGRVLPVVDLRSRFGLPQEATGKETRIVVVELGEVGVVGFRVDRVREVIRLDESTVEATPELAKGVDATYIRGVARLEDRLLILVDLQRVVRDGEIEALAA